MTKVQLVIAIGLFMPLGALADSSPSEGSDAKQQEILAVAKKLARPSLSYRTTVGERMLEEANYFARKLNLPIQQPITFQSVANIIVTAPWYSRTENPDTNLSITDRILKGKFYAGGAIEVDRFYMAFNKGQLWSIQRMQLRNESSITDLYAELAKTPSLIDTNEALALAKKWLASVSVDIKTVELKNKPQVIQWHLNIKPEDIPKDGMPIESASTNVTMLPIFDVQWGEGENFLAKVTVIGTTKELFRLEVRDVSLSKRPLLEVPNAVELNTRPEPQLMQLHPTATNQNRPQSAH